jgi:hypothetical protein
MISNNTEDTPEETERSRYSLHLLRDMNTDFQIRKVKRLCEAHLAEND